jgi:diaminopimelate epimerase
MSGNGTRIAARWLAEQTGADMVRVRVGGREAVARMLGGGFVEQQLAYRVGGPETVAGVPLTTVDVGNPHAVVDGDPADLPRLGPLLERHPRFPERTNVQVARRVDDTTIEARVWERGVGETASSGTSAVAVAAAFGAGEVRIRFPGGDLHVRLDGEHAYLTGTAEPTLPGATTP